MSEELSVEDLQHLNKYFKKLFRKVHRKRLIMARKLSRRGHRVDPNDIEIEEVTEPDEDGYFSIILQNSEGQNG